MEEKRQHDEQKTTEGEETSRRRLRVSVPGVKGGQPVVYPSCEIPPCQCGPGKNCCS